MAVAVLEPKSPTQQTVTVLRTRARNLDAQPYLDVFFGSFIRDYGGWVFIADLLTLLRNSAGWTVSVFRGSTRCARYFVFDIGQTFQ